MKFKAADNLIKFRFENIKTQNKKVRSKVS